MKFKYSLFTQFGWALVKMVYSNRIPFRYVSLKHILSFAFILRVLCVFFFANLGNENYWEYGTIAKNILLGKGFAYNFVDNNNVLLEDSYPSAYVAPLYVFFVLPFLFIKEIVLRNAVLFLVQSLLSVLAIYFIYKSTLHLMGRNVAIITSVLLSITPELIFTPCTIGPTTIFHLLLAIWFYLRLVKDQKATHKWMAGFIAGILCLFRSEVILFFIMSALFDVLMKAYFSNALILITSILICLSPWLIRNYLIFGKVVITNNAGLNLCRGNNAITSGGWAFDKDPTIYPNLKANSGNKFEKAYDDECVKIAVNFVKDNPVLTIKNFAMKFFKHFIFDWHDQRCYQILYLVPWFFTLIFAIYGVSSTSWTDERFSNLYLFQISYCIIVMVFFAQLRYQTLIKFQLMPFAALGIVQLFDKSKNTETHF